MLRRHQIWSRRSPLDRQSYRNSPMSQASEKLGAVVNSSNRQLGEKMSQERIRRNDGSEPDVPDVPAVAQAQAQADTADVDALLDEIDDVLESNAETFVRGFVQKGGQ